MISKCQKGDIQTDRQTDTQTDTSIIMYKYVTWKPSGVTTEELHF